eukprot:CAMPEP_0119025442 /NCGR_PEP_ID=MMETSP1176-20130426/33750_1 /TAXON_ID=265551 /ORGANISM="Synedropsis recta cf, Strain CCMP1620" /LENGTH=563 /DNA_ID=CAMNT_0006980979 /DNA_START=120 /DNA_END=1811 /DNA_ORIENTATION=+
MDTFSPPHPPPTSPEVASSEKKNEPIPPPPEASLSPLSSGKHREHAGSFRALPDLRQSQKISDGGSILIANSERSSSFSTVRAGNQNSSSSSETYIASLIDDLQTSLQALEAYPPLSKLEEWAIFIHECLSRESRKFHSVHHVFEISAGCDPLQLLAAFFRDAISCITDGGFTTRQEARVGDIVVHHHDTAEEEGSRYTLTKDTDRLVDLVMDIFGLEAGQDISESYRGLDVFLSAVLMARLLRETLSEPLLAQIAVCMEATIPFRRPSSTGKTALDLLYDRLEKANMKYELDMEITEMIEAIQRAADLNNRNLGNFASEDAVFFLDHTWSLLPERSASLRRSYLYSVNDMASACHEMSIFLSDLDTNVVFQSFRGLPNDDEMEFFQQRLSSNLAKGRKYMSAKLLAVTVCSALATLSGGDVPMSFFAGDLPTHNYHSDRLGEDFPTFDYKELTNNCDNDVYLILNRGRQLEQSFDTRNAPIAAYLYASLGDDGVAAALKQCCVPMTMKSSMRLLKHLPRQNVQIIATDVGKIAVSRVLAIQELMVELFGQEEQAHDHEVVTG